MCQVEKIKKKPSLRLSVGVYFTRQERFSPRHRSRGEIHPSLKVDRGIMRWVCDGFRKAFRVDEVEEKRVNILTFCNRARSIYIKVLKIGFSGREESLYEGVGGGGRKCMLNFKTSHPKLIKRQQGEAVKWNVTISNLPSNISFI